MIHAGVTEKHFKEKLPRVLGLGNTTPDAATMTTAVRGLMFGDYLVPGQLSADLICHAAQAFQTSHTRRLDNSHTNVLPYTSEVRPAA